MTQNKLFESRGVISRAPNSDYKKLFLMDYELDYGTQKVVGLCFD
jgi:hypothetical protein